MMSFKSKYWYPYNLGAGWAVYYMAQGWDYLQPESWSEGKEIFPDKESLEVALDRLIGRDDVRYLRVHALEPVGDEVRLRDVPVEEVA
jgi:hypothetical protein